RALGHGQLGEQVGRQQVEVDLAVGVGAVNWAGGGYRDLRIVQQDLGKAGTEATDLDVHALAGHVARDTYARDAGYGFGDVLVREFAEIFGIDGILEAD